MENRHSGKNLRDRFSCRAGTLLRSITSKMSAHEKLEHAEHAAHSGSHGARHMGLTMAILGVLIAFAAAMVGSQRQELMTSLLDQSWAHSSSTAASIKVQVNTNELGNLRDRPAAANDLARLLQTDAYYSKEAELARKWDDSCEGLIDAHYDAAEGYEHAQVIAEVAIIIASVGILLGSRIAWVISLVAGVLCLGQMGYNFVSSRSAIADHHEKVHAAEHAYEHHTEQHVDAKQHDELLNQLDPGSKLRGASATTETTHGEHSSPTPEPSKSE